MEHNYGADLANGLVEEILKVIHKYDETMVVATAVGCLEIAKQQLILEQFQEEG